ncbi:hypothetical protein GW17_00062290 [Ensete ventricosum]|nr:hypothetical protein GW17_00062290 [Ensete ventricosum]
MDPLRDPSHRARMFVPRPRNRRARWPAGGALSSSSFICVRGVRTAIAGHELGGSVGGIEIWWWNVGDGAKRCGLGKRSGRDEDGLLLLLLTVG